MSAIVTKTTEAAETITVACLNDELEKTVKEYRAKGYVLNYIDVVRSGYKIHFQRSHLLSLNLWP